MKNKDLKNYNVRTDLIIDHEVSIKSKKRINSKSKNITITDIIVNKKTSKEINKQEGRYITITFNDITDINNKIDLKNIFKKQLVKMLKEETIVKANKCLIIGLGNVKSTPDSLGPKVLEKVLVTKHLFDIKSFDVDKKYRSTSILSPGVFGITGIQSKDIIKGTIKQIKPDFVIIIDALVSSSIDRINKTIQMTNTGINPGSGIGNNRGELSFKTLKIPVIAIGVPTVVDSSTIVIDTLKYILKKLTSIKKTNLTKVEKEHFLGIIGSLQEEDLKNLIQISVNKDQENMMVTFKEIDLIIENLTEILSKGINEALHD